MVLPWETRDQEEQAEAVYNAPIRAKARQLEAENLKLKQALRLAGFSWSNGNLHRIEQDGSNGFLPDAEPEAGQLVLTSQQITRRSRSTRASTAQDTRRRLPHLPVEVQLRVLEYAVTATQPIIDPLCKTSNEHLVAKEKARGNQLTIGFLLTCKAYHVEGTRMLWENNTFTFTNVQALARFAELDLSTRRKIEHINLRITARFYDDDHDRKHYLDAAYHPSMKKKIGLKVILRQKDNDLARKGFRSYSWNQVVDFLQALRPPFDPKHKDGTPRPRLLPSLISMRIDLVNFPEYFLPYPDNELHEMAAHQLGCSLNELTVTGIPRCEMGAKATADFNGMVKDDGLFIDALPAFLHTKSGMKALAHCDVHNIKAVRAWRAPVLKANADAAAARAKKAAAKKGAASNSNSASMDDSSSDSDDDFHGHSHAKAGTSPNMPAAPEEHGHPESTWKKRRTIWKRVPENRDSDERHWVEFDRASGLPMSDLSDIGESDDEDVLICSKCGDLHENESFGTDDFSHFDPFDLDPFGF